MVVDHRNPVHGDYQLSVVFPTDTDIVYKFMEEVLDIIEALRLRASVLQNELGRIQLAIRAESGTTAVKIGRTGRKWHHTAATKRKLALAQRKIWAAKQKLK